MACCQDQQVLGYVFSSLSKEVLTQVASLPSTAILWAAVEQMFSSQSRADTINIRMAMSNINKGNMSVADYFSKKKALVDDMHLSHSFK